jgi:hypothetical protein
VFHSIIGATKLDNAFVCLYAPDLLSVESSLSGTYTIILVRNSGTVEALYMHVRPYKSGCTTPSSSVLQTVFLITTVFVLFKLRFIAKADDLSFSKRLDLVESPRLLKSDRESYHSAGCKLKLAISIFRCELIA